MKFNDINKLEYLNFTHFYSDQLIPNGKKNPNDVVLNLSIYTKLAGFDITHSLARRIA
ncbi:MAG: hypothetical protein ACTSPY_18335 [Candidatus Helarchaeota archaeon]